MEEFSQMEIFLISGFPSVPFGMKDGAFGTGNDEETLFEKGNYGTKYGMSRNRFFFIDEKLKFCMFTDAEKRQVHV